MSNRVLSIVAVALAVLVANLPLGQLAPAEVIAAPASEAVAPAEAEVLVAEGVSGHLAAGEATWYRYYPSGISTGQPDRVTLIVTPAVELGAQTLAINFQIFSCAQVMSGGDASVMTPIGSGSSVSRDGDPNTAEYLWQGALPGSDAFCVRVANGTATPIDYWLFPADVLRVEPPSTAIQAAGVTPPGAAPDVPLDLAPAQTGFGRLGPGQEAWYRLLPGGYGPEPGSSVLTMFFTPGDTSHADWVGFEVMTEAQVRARQAGQINLNTGAGAIVSRDSDPVTGERLWRGALPGDQAFLVRIHNGPDTVIDYRLFQGDVEHPVFDQQAGDQATVAALPVTGAENTALAWQDWHVSVTCATQCSQQ
jgi:hypothetical protein